MYMLQSQPSRRRCYV